MSQIKVGKITATSAEASGGKNVNVGFIPEYLKVWNEDAADGEVAILERFGGQADDASLAYYKMTNGTGTDNTLVDDTTNGLTDYSAGSIAEASDEVSDSGFQGFTIPAAFIGDGDVIHYLAIGAEDTV